MELLKVAIQPGESLIVTASAIIIVSNRHPPPAAYSNVQLDEPIDAAREGSQFGLKDFTGLERVTVCHSGSLPTEVLGHMASRHVDRESVAVVYPRAEFVHLRLSWLRGLMALRRHGPGREVLLAGIPFWRNRRVAAFLRRLRYPVV